jgi:hypothetical protein
MERVLGQGLDSSILDESFAPIPGGYNPLKRHAETPEEYLAVLDDERRWKTR